MPITESKTLAADSCRRTQAEIIRLRAALEEIADLEFWKGVQMREIAVRALYPKSEPTE